MLSSEFIILFMYHYDQIISYCLVLNIRLNTDECKMAGLTSMASVYMMV